MSSGEDLFTTPTPGTSGKLDPRFMTRDPVTGALIYTTAGAEDQNFKTSDPLGARTDQRGVGEMNVLSKLGYASNYQGGSPLGAAFGYTPQDLVQQSQDVGARDQQAIQQAAVAGQGQLNAAAQASYQGGQGLLDNSYQTAAYQQGLGQQGLAQSQALADYNTGQGQQALQGMSSLGAQANQASGYYGGEGQQQLGAQQDYAAQGLAQLGQIRQQAQQAVGNLNAGAGTSAAGQGYYSGQSAGYGQGAQASQQISAGGYGQLAGQGIADQAQMGALGSQQGQAANYYGGQGAVQSGYANDDRASALAAVNRLQNFYQQGPGPSAAQAQLASASDQNQANAISLANSGHNAGDNAQAMRQAMFSNAATQQQTAGQMATLRAQEDAAWRGQQLGAMGTEQSSLGNIRGQDIGAATSNANLSQGFSGLGQQAYQSGAQLGQAATSGAAAGYAGLGGQQLQGQDSLAQLGLGYGQLGQTYTQNAGQLGMQAGGVEQQALQGWGGQSLSGAQASGQLGLGYGQLGQQYYQNGQQAAQGYGQLANSALSTGLGYQQGMQGLSNQASANGANAYATMSGQGNALQQASAGVGLQGAGQATAIDQSTQGQLQDMYGKQLSAETSRYGADKNVAIAQMADSSNNTAATIGGIATLGAGLLTMSDRRGKKNLRQRIFDLRPAKGYAYEYKRPDAPGAAKGTHFGPMAQDLEKSPAARASVVNVGNRKMVDTGRLSLMLASAVGEEQRRGDKLAGSIKRLEAMLEKSA